MLQDIGLMQWIIAALLFFVGFVVAGAVCYQHQLNCNIRNHVPSVRGRYAYRSEYRCTQRFLDSCKKDYAYYKFSVRDRRIIEIDMSGYNQGEVHDFYNCLAEMGLDIIIVKHHKNPYIQQ